MRTRLAIPLVLLLVAALVPVLPVPSADAAVSEVRLKRLNFFYRFQQGRNYWNSNSYLEAAAHFESLMSQYMELPRPLQLQLDYYLGSSYHELEMYDTAQPYLEKLAYQPFLPAFVIDSATRLLDIYARRGNRADVVKIYEAAASKPLTPQLKVKLDYGASQAFFRLGEYRRVRELALRIDPDTPEAPRALLLSAYAMMNARELGAAEEDLKRVLRNRTLLREFNIESLEPEVQVLLAKVHFDQGAYTKSVQVLTQVRAPEFQPDVKYIRGWSMMMLGQYLQGMESFRDLALEHPEDLRSIEGTILGGYVLLNLAQFVDSYAYFETLETQYRDASDLVLKFRRNFRSAEAFDLLLRDPSRLQQAPIPSQVAKWVHESRDYVTISQTEDRINFLGQKLEELTRNMRRMRVISAGFGSSFENPATLERLLRNHTALRLTEIRSEILELMLKPVREDLLMGSRTEYNMINQAQSIRRNALRVIRLLADPTKERAETIQVNLRRIGHYMFMVASEDLAGVPDPAVKELPEELQFSVDPVDIVNRLLIDEEGLALELLKVMEEEEQLWNVVSNTIAIERAAAESVLRRLGLWETQTYLDRLELLYRSTTGIETILTDNGQLLLAIQREILDEVLEYTSGVADELAALDGYYDNLASAAKSVRLQTVDREYANVAQLFREAEAQTAGGQLDVGWRLKEVENEVMRDVLVSEQRRQRQLDQYYQNVQDRAAEAARKVQVIDERLKQKIASSASGGQSVAYSEAVEAIDEELGKMETYVAELLRGSSWIVERAGTVTWTQDKQR